MRRRITWRSAAAIAMLGLAPGIGAAFAVPAGASTDACLAALGTQCGTFTESVSGQEAKSGSDGGLGWDVKGQSSAADTPLIEYKNYSPGIDPGTDLTKVEHYGPIPGSPSATPGYWYSIVYTPSGKWTSMCVANPDNKGMGGKNLVLRSCNRQVWQTFLAETPPSPSPSPSPSLSFSPSQPGPPPPPTSLQIPNTNTPSDGAFALYSMANGKLVTGRAKGKALSATGSTGSTGAAVKDTTNSWFWTNANGTGP